MQKEMLQPLRESRALTLKIFLSAAMRALQKL